MVYERHDRPEKILKLIMKNLKTFMAFTSCHGKLFACPLSTLNGRDYIILDFKIKSEKEKRKTKVAPPQEQHFSEVTQVMGSTSMKDLLPRMQFIEKMWNTHGNIMDTAD